MKYFLLISNSEGEARLVPISDVMEVAVEPGDDIVVMDESGKAVDVSLRPDDDDLIVDFQDGSKAVLKDFYNQEEDSDPITISLNPVEPVADDYEFNSQTGNLPNAKSFTLMRYSNTEYVQFVEQLDELKGGVIEGSLLGSGNAGTTGLFNNGVYLYGGTLNGGVGSDIRGTGGGGTRLNYGVYILSVGMTTLGVGNVSVNVPGGGVAPAELIRFI